MTEEGTTSAAPTEGQDALGTEPATFDDIPVAEQVAEPERAPSRQERVGAIWGKLGVAVAVLLVLVGCFLASRALLQKLGDKDSVPSPTPASSEERGTGYVSGSWGEVSQHLQDTDVRARWDAMDAAMAEYRGFEIPDEAITDHLVREVELADPDRYVWTADRPLTGWLNTNWDRVTPKIFEDSFQVGDQFLVMEVNILAKYGVDVSKIQAEALVALPDGTVCVILTRAVCTNHVWPGAPKIVRTCDWCCHRDRGKLPMYSGPLQTPHHPENPYTQDDPSYDVRTPTEGYNPGNTEAVESRRGTGEGTTGAPGTGTDGTTPGGSITIGDVTIVTDGAPPPGVPVDGDSDTPIEPGNTGLDPGDLGND